MPRLSGQDSESSQNWNRILSLCCLGTGIGIEFKACVVSEPDTELCSSHGQSRNRNQNRVPRLYSLRTGIGIEKTITGNLWATRHWYPIRVECGYYSLSQSSSFSKCSKKAENGQILPEVKSHFFGHFLSKPCLLKTHWIIAMKPEPYEVQKDKFSEFARSLLVRWVVFEMGLKST